MTGEYCDDEPGATDNDRWALANGYVSLTPTLMDVTAYEMLDKMKGWESPSRPPQGEELNQSED